jgi:hypothetical protein
VSAVGSGVLDKLQRRLPNQIGTNRQWTTSYISSLILAAAHAAEERLGMTWVSSEVAMTNNTSEYPLDSKFIEVVTVEFALDGTTYQRELEAVTFEDLDHINLNWRDDTGQEPTRYALLSTPGTQSVTDATPLSGSRIVIHRKMGTAGSAKIKVSGWGIGTAASNVPDGAQERVFIPYILSILRAEHDVKEANWFYDKFLTGCDEIKGRFGDGRGA